MAKHQEMALSPAYSAIIDGPLDSKCDISQLTEVVKLKRREQYVNYFRTRGHLKTAAGQDLSFDLDTDANCLDWVEDGNISIATTACDLCSEINTCRPKGAPPFVCLVRATPQSKRKDGTSVCALCMHVRRNPSRSYMCRARGGKDPASLPAPSNKKRKSSGDATTTKGGTGGLDEDSLFGSDLSDEEDAEDMNLPYPNHRRIVEDESADRLKNWNSPTFVDKSLSKSTQRQPRNTAFGTSDPSTSTTIHSTQLLCDSVVGQSTTPGGPIRSRHSMPLAINTTSRDALQPIIAGLDSDQESVDIPLSQLIGRRGNAKGSLAGEILPRGGNEVVDNSLTAPPSSHSQQSEVEMLCERQTSLLKSLRKDSKAPSFFVEQLLWGQARLSELIEASRSTSIRVDQHKIDHEDVSTIDGMSAMIKAKEKELSDLKARYKVMLQQEIEKCKLGQQSARD